VASYLGLSGNETRAPASSVTYAAMVGIPFLRKSQGDTVQTKTSDSSLLAEVESLIHMQDITTVESLFNFETQYFYLNCSVGKGQLNDTSYNLTDNSSVPTNFWTESPGFVTDGDLLSIDFDYQHNASSTEPRRIGLESYYHALTEAWCDVTQTYVEGKAFCTDGNDCQVIAIRDSTKPHPPAVVTSLDDLGYPLANLNYDKDASVASHFFQAFVNNSGSYGRTSLSLTEYYFINPAAPTKSVLDGNTKELYSIGDELFSQRFSQLLNTFWLASIAPFSIAGSFSAYPPDQTAAQTQGTIRIVEDVMKCNIPYLVILFLIALVLLVATLVTSYLDGIRRGPDVLDNFVNSLRHSPFVNVDQGPTLEDGVEKAKRLRGTVIKMGDVKPQDEVGYVAIATPSAAQPVEPLVPLRTYV
jgi:hypothetical protein